MDSHVEHENTHQFALWNVPSDTRPLIITCKYQDNSNLLSTVAVHSIRAQSWLSATPQWCVSDSVDPASRERSSQQCQQKPPTCPLQCYDRSEPQWSPRGLRSGV